jgi:hypothetical protein
MVLTLGAELADNVIDGRCRINAPPAGYRRPTTRADEETPMTDTNDAVISEALSVIDKALSQMMSRELVSSGEVTDVLLDVRSLLTPAHVAADH